MPGTLKCHGVVRELKEVGGTAEEEERGGERSRGEKSSHTGGAGLRAYQCVLDVALAGAAKANQMQRRALCATACQVRPGST